jgi:hypothetical protein
MRYTNPLTKSLHFQKTWFFLDGDVRHVMLSNISSDSGASIRSVLDQRRAKGPVPVDGSESGSSKYSNFQTLWHGEVGYKFSSGNVSLSIELAQKTGDWTKIGTSGRPPVNMNPSLLPSRIPFSLEQMPTPSPIKAPICTYKLLRMMPTSLPSTTKIISSSWLHSGMLQAVV